MVGGDSTYWEWSDEVLRHPDGRATGGEPCVQCGEPVPANAHWKHRDRHVCSERCNRNLRRKFNRRRDRGELVPPRPTPPATDRGGAVFGTDPEAEFPYEFLGWAPLVGDVVERHGSVVAYLPEEPLVVNGESHLVAACWHVNTGAFAIVKAEPDGRVGGIWWGCFTPAGERIGVRTFFDDGTGRNWIWTWEVIRDVDPDGKAYTWSAPICVEREPDRLWTPAYQQRSRRLRRTSASTAAHARRVRLAGPEGVAARIDPLEVYERDGWVCSLCGGPVDPLLKHPDPFSASLDHRVPLAAGGAHVASNVALAHLRCNIRKGARLAPAGW